MPKCPGVRKYKAKNRYLFSYYITWHGHTIEKRGFITQEDALSARIEVLKVLNDGEYIPSSRSTVQQLYDRYMKDYAEGTLAYTTLRDKEGRFNKYILPATGHLRIRDLHSLHITRLRGKLPTSSVKYNVLKDLHALFVWAKDERLISHYPDFKVPTYTAKVHPILSEDEVRTLLRDLKGRDLAIFACYYYTGKRGGEVVALRWKDFDFKNDTITFKRQCTAGQVKDTLKTPKSKNEIDLSPELKTILLAWQPECGSLIWVFPGRKGKPIGSDTWRNRWEEIKKRYGLPKDLRPHDLRHSHATHELAHGTPAHIVAARLGHSKISTTIDRYGHVTVEDLKKASRLLGKG